MPQSASRTSPKITTWSPTSLVSATLQAAKAIVSPPSRGTPLSSAGRHGTRSKWYWAESANSRATGLAESPSRFTPKRPCERSELSVPLVTDRQTDRTGGSRLTLESEEQVIPRGRPSVSTVVTTETPVGKELMNVR